MHTSTWWFWGWFALLGVLPAVVASLSWRPWMRLPASLFPWLTGAMLWLHGVWFDPPNNFATMSKFGVVGFWFKPHRTFDLERVGLLPYVLLSLPVLFFTPMVLTALGRAEHTAREVLWAVPPLVLGMLCLRGIPDHLVDLVLHQSSVLANPGRWVDVAMPGVLVRAGMAALPLMVGLGLWILATRPKSGPSAHPA